MLSGPACWGESSTGRCSSSTLGNPGGRETSWGRLAAARVEIYWEVQSSFQYFQPRYLIAGHGNLIYLWIVGPTQDSLFNNKKSKYLSSTHIPRKSCISTPPPFLQSFLSFFGLSSHFFTHEVFFFMSCSQSNLFFPQTVLTFTPLLIT